MILGISGLADIEGFLHRQFPARMQQANLIQGMDAAAALIHDGRVLAAVSQERFDRTKKSSAFPYDAIDYCLKTAGIPLTEVAAVCGNFNFARYHTYMNADYYSSCLSPDAIDGKLTARYGKVRFQPMDHHESHLYEALISCPFDDGLAVVMDAAGEVASTTIYQMNGRPNGHIKVLKRYPIRKSLGVIFSLITQFLGFRPNEDEYKVMGMASFGDPRRYAEFFERHIQLLPDGEIDIPVLQANVGFEEGLFFSGSARVLREGLRFDGADAEFQQRADLSAGLQHRFTEALFHIVSHYRMITGKTNLLMSGGCAENCNAIGELRRNGLFKQIHVAYASGDEGTALGAAAAYSAGQGHAIRLPNEMPFYGPKPIQERIESVAHQRGVQYQAFMTERDMLQAAAEDIARDAIIAICHGRMEYGARALGNRSLLALSTNPDNKERINKAIKKRELFRPFAPAVTVEDASDYFELQATEAYPYMTMLTRVRPHVQVPAVTHVDGTARVQTVDRRHNPNFHYLLSHLKKLTGVPVVLNTSFNVNHQPIVCTEEEAIATLQDMEIDALYMANCKLTLS